MFDGGFDMSPLISPPLIILTSLCFSPLLSGFCGVTRAHAGLVPKHPEPAQIASAVQHQGSPHFQLRLRVLREPGASSHPAAHHRRPTRKPPPLPLSTPTLRPGKFVPLCCHTSLNQETTCPTCSLDSPPTPLLSGLILRDTISEHGHSPTHPPRPFLFCAPFWGLLSQSQLRNWGLHSRAPPPPPHAVCFCEALASRKFAVFHVDHPPSIAGIELK